MTNLCKIEDVAAEWDVPKSSLRTAAEDHGFLVRFGDTVRVMRDDLTDLKPLAEDEANKPAVANRLYAAIENLKHPPVSAPEVCRNIPTDIRRQVVERDGYICAYCGKTEGPFALDHIYPFSRGGLHTAENLTVACQACNSSKGDKLLKNWKGRPQ